jgi:hypothetical protein
MKRHQVLTGAVVTALLLVTGLAYAQGTAPERETKTQAALGTAFTYQGRLTDDGEPVDDQCDLSFKLYDAAGSGTPPSGGTVLGTVNRPNQEIDQGYFTVQLDFGSGVFTGEERWLQVSVDCGDGSVTLSPRQPLTPAPYALALPGLWTEQNETSPNLIGGHRSNNVQSEAEGATIGGGGDSTYPNGITANYGTVGGGRDNKAGLVATVGGGETNTASGGRATVGGGDSNTASGDRATVGGGYHNAATGDRATVGGGRYNQANADYATIAGGGGDTGDYGNRVTDDHGTVSGGGNNQAGDDGGTTEDATCATVSGGLSNTASAWAATVGGGITNTVSGWSSTIGGGNNNLVTAPDAVIGGGENNVVENGFGTVGGGNSNRASGANAAVGGGHQNTASGLGSTIPGGGVNSASGDYSFAAGRRAKANNDGCFVWGDSTDADVPCNDDNAWVARAAGGVTFYSNSSLSTGVHLAPGASQWAPIPGFPSDRNLKGNVIPVDAQSVLERVAELPISTWSYKSSDGVRHMGPMAQDFYAAFGLGDDDKRIHTMDTVGVALASIQGLYAEVQEKEAQIAELRANNTDLQTQVDHLESRVQALEQLVKEAPVEEQKTQLGSSFDRMLAGGLLLGTVVLWQRRREGGAP